MWDNVLFLKRLASLLFAITAVLLVYGGWKLLVSSPTFNFRQVIVTGQTRHMTQAMIEAAAKSSIRGNFFGQKLDDIQISFEKLPWVKAVSVRRVWPDKLYIDIMEHSLFARWGNSALVAKDGALFQGATDEVLPVLFGPDGSQIELKNRLEEITPVLESIQATVGKLELSKRYAWTLTLQAGETVRLGREDKPGAVKERLAHFVAEYPKLKNRYQDNLLIVDMRYANGFSVTLKPAHQVASVQ